MSTNPNLIKIQNNLSKEFQKWKFQREQNHNQVIDDIQRSSLFFKFSKAQSKQDMLNPSSISSQNLNKMNFTSPKTNNPTKALSSSLSNFRKTIIIDGIKDKNHVYNQLFNSQENLPFVPYINERDKLGRLVKDFEKSDVKINDVNIVNQISNNQRRLHFQPTLHAISYEDLSQKNSSLPSENIHDDLETQKQNAKKLNQSKHQKSLSNIPYSSQNNNSTNLPDKMRSSTFYSTISNKGQSSNKLNQLLKGIGSFQQISMVNIPEQSFQGKHTFIDINSLQQINMNYDNHENFNENQSSLLTHKQSIPSLNQLNQNKSFTQLISYNSQPCSPSRFITKIQSNNNSLSVEEKIFEVDKNKQFKCSQEEVVKKTQAFYKKYIDSKIKRENLESKQEFPTKFKAKVLPLKFPESAKASHACRILFNHSKKIEKFNKMIDRNDPNILNFVVDNKQKNTEKYKNAMESYKKRFSIAAGFNFQNTQKKNDERKQLKEQKRQQILEKWGERVDSSELDDEEEKYRKKILNPILSKEQQIQKEREHKRKVFDDYEKWYTLQMYYIESSDKAAQL